MNTNIDLAKAGPIVLAMAAAITENQARLGEIDGATGDGDHGINMGKGFRLAAARLAEKPGFTLAEGFATLGDTLLGDIGGSMGPLYGTFFSDMAETLTTPTLDREGCSRMLHAGLAAIQSLGQAKPGDKTLVDVLAPSIAAFDQAPDFPTALGALKTAAAESLEATRTMVARLGRAARLGERSRGHLDAGAASCALLLTTLSNGLLSSLPSREGPADGGPQTQ